MLRALDLTDKGIGAVLRPVLFFLMAALIVAISLQVGSRLFFRALGWTEEVSRFLVIWITFLGAALAWHQHRHIAVGALVDALPVGYARLVRIAACVVVIGFMVALVKVGLDYMGTQGRQRSAALRLSMGRVYTVIPLSAALMAWFALSDLLRLLVGGKVPMQGGAGQ